jgi:hypothetical protein
MDLYLFGMAARGVHFPLALMIKFKKLVRFVKPIKFGLMLMRPMLGFLGLYQNIEKR